MLRLSKFLETQKPGPRSNSIDILFIEQIYRCHTKEHKIFLKFLKHMVRYAKERPELKVKYSGRFEPKPDKGSLKNIDSVLTGSPIKRVNDRGVEGSYKHILDTNVVVSYDSSIRLEALAMGKAVLTCNDQGREGSTTGVWDYVLAICDPMFAVESDKYQVFKSKLDFLLSKSNSAVVSYAKEKLVQSYCWDKKLMAGK